MSGDVAKGRTSVDNRCVDRRTLMTTFLNSTSFSIRTGVLLVALAATLASADRAIAGCGDHVIVLKPAGSPENGLHAPDPNPPCRGPGCSSRPSEPLAPPISAPVVSNSLSKDVATPIPAASDYPTIGFAGFSDCGSMSPERFPTSIFHPPRI